MQDAEILRVYFFNCIVVKVKAPIKTHLYEFYTRILTFSLFLFLVHDQELLLINDWNEN